MSPSAGEKQRGRKGELFPSLDSCPAAHLPKPPQPTSPVPPGHSWLWNAVTMRRREYSWLRKGQGVTIRADIYWELTVPSTVLSHSHAQTYVTYTIALYGGHHNYPHFAEKEIETRKAHWGRVELEFKPRSMDPQVKKMVWGWVPTHDQRVPLCAAVLSHSVVPDSLRPHGL